MGIAGVEVVEDGEIDPVFSFVGAGAIVAAYEVLGAGGTVRLIGERRAAGRSMKVPEELAGGLSMALSSSTHRPASSVRSHDILGRLLIASRMYLICLASDGIKGPGHDPAIKGSLGPSRPFYPVGSVIEFVS
ncbi:hypothetical protein B9Z19DRAFT_1104103 [Tuber borchii]|uniref:Uncharacterized protein n=1 Tax=Tuber borchii TaxID=42251 RepID=A0A2T6ZC20_TUBBO|nr:hypothetical protein B9Z19DRAFT_1104103 [Tuber borchii]